ncbi:UbiH/UbiF/VisC/COQ6 family ubiquinone biosynthesis hydroxylase [Marinibactrum halimedae]|uniref:2-octaprenyl-3-methyl-6-methoxy-1,4-benzoquinol hydroxylase n=1 Tax=Marinibactrum halimedae TaxID=1444977 RepID=A0AA37WKF3_9GAMM|nr:UbiH/UbiF/VisC/COQ6 family ubiquinone biosynthesis hydroxylase [Marinibactrum halimedae]MCD9457724.1 UbiH/UbiF/VisC/COQ6 family ubiquinone biosynthesis hydroxylase [Marinibactrum halimedae]GLS24903.1 2-octaprenyl-3-methyl-6-methoxy-1,4-benzoquinol hydroxylase [Marinibactrum halimedae]
MTNNTETLEPNNKQPPSTEHTYDIVIVGGGLVGASLAASLLLKADVHNESLGHPPLSIALIDAGPKPEAPALDKHDARVVALTRESETLLRDIGAWQSIEKLRACPYTHMTVWDADGTGQIHFDCRELAEPNLGHIVENRVALYAVYEQLENQDAISLWHHSTIEHIAPDNTLTLSDGRTVQGTLIVAADGAHSKIRTLTNFATREWDYGHHAIVTTVKTQHPHQSTAWQRFLPTGPLAFLPLLSNGTDGDTSLASPSSLSNSEEHYSSIVWSIEEKYAHDLMAMNDDSFKQALSDAFEYTLGEVTWCDKRACFPLRQRHAQRYYQNGIVLIGDAAHTIHPLAGQGVNLGLLDVNSLCEEITRARKRGIPLDDISILKRYQRHRKPHNLGVMAVMEGFKQLFGTKAISLRWIRNEGMRQLNRLTPLKNPIVRRAMGITGKH